MRDVDSEVRANHTHREIEKLSSARYEGSTFKASVLQWRSLVEIIVTGATEDGHPCGQAL